jgi:hypothetical protein
MKHLIKPEVMDTLILAISGAIASTVVLLIVELVIVIKQPNQLTHQQITLLPVAVVGAAVGGMIFGGLGWIIFRLATRVAERMATQVVLGAIGGMIGMMTILYWLTWTMSLSQ